MHQNELIEGVMELVSIYLEENGDTEDTRDEVDNAIRYGVEDAYSEADMQKQLDEEED